MIRDGYNDPINFELRQLVGRSPDDPGILSNWRSRFVLNDLLTLLSVTQAGVMMKYDAIIGIEIAAVGLGIGLGWKYLMSKRLQNN